MGGFRCLADCPRTPLQVWMLFAGFILVATAVVRWRPWLIAVALLAWVYVAQSQLGQMSGAVPGPHRVSSSVAIVLAFVMPLAVWGYGEWLGAEGSIIGAVHHVPATRRLHVRLLLEATIGILLAAGPVHLLRGLAPRPWAWIALAAGTLAAITFAEVIRTTRGRRAGA